MVNITPIVPMGALEYLEKAFRLSDVITNTKVRNNDELVGYMRGVVEVMNVVRMLANPKGDNLEDVLEN